MPPTLLAIPFPTLLDPVALEVGPLAIRWYALAYMAGFLLGWRYALRLADRYPAAPDRVQIDAFLTWAVIGVILGGRMGYVLFYQPEILRNPADILAVWQGGMAFHGGALGVILAILLYARLNRIPVLRLGDIVCAVVPLGLLFGRLANFVNNELWGRPTDLPWGVVFPIPDHLEATLPEVPRHPSQLYEAFGEGLLLLLLLGWLIRQQAVRDRPGVVAGCFLAGYGLVRFLIEYVREPDIGVPLLFGLISRGQQLSLPMILIGAALAIWAWTRNHRPASAAPA